MSEVAVSHLPSPTELLRRHGLRARKSWGQNFLHDPRVHAAIVAASEAAPGRRVVEIGAGLGSLTVGLLRAGADVWAIERDRDMCGVLREELGAHPRFVLHEADAVRFDFAAATQADGAPPTIVGNLPYHLTAPLLFALLAMDHATGAWVVMVQREVAERLLAPPGSRTYGAATITLSRTRAIRRICDAPRGAFTPPPRVDSMVIRLDRREQPLGVPVDHAPFSALVRGVFQRRRKTLLNALTPIARDDRARAAGWIAEAGVDPQARPEQLDVAAFTRLTAACVRSGDVPPSAEPERDTEGPADDA
jgi:16S rRNA (adenine1518-N6/adenine1519-N6)-dimethyltransferase